MGENIRGYETSEIVRRDAGSPASFYSFANRMEAVLIDNLGSPGIYANFAGAAGSAVSGNSFFVPNNSFRAFDLRIGSVSIYAPGGSPNVQVIGVRD